MFMILYIHIVKVREKEMVKKILRLSLAGLLCIGFALSANAAATVKKFGGTAVTPTKTSNTSSSRTGSVRLNASNGVKAAVKTKTVSNVNTSDSNASRISLGKYLHGANVVKQNAANSAYEDPNLASRDSLILRDKISANEGEIADVKQEMEDHINNKDIHVTLEDKDVWNGKQDALSAGKGINIEEGVISATMKLPVGSETGERRAAIWVE